MGWQPFLTESQSRFHQNITLWSRPCASLSSCCIIHHWFRVADGLQVTVHGWDAFGCAQHAVKGNEGPSTGSERVRDTRESKAGLDQKIPCKTTLIDLQGIWVELCQGLNEKTKRLSP